jgi:hypothetical protein
MTTRQLFRVHRRIKIRDQVLQPGDVVDLVPFALPSGRAEQLVAQRKGEFVSDADAVAAVPDIAQTVIDGWAVSGGATEPDVTTDEPLHDWSSDDGLSAPVDDIAGRSRDELLALSVPALRDIAHARGLPVRGSKAAIVDRLMGAGTPS